MMPLTMCGWVDLVSPDIIRVIRGLITGGVAQLTKPPTDSIITDQAGGIITTAAAAAPLSVCVCPEGFDQIPPGDDKW